MICSYSCQPTAIDNVINLFFRLNLNLNDTNPIANFFFCAFMCNHNLN